MDEKSEEMIAAFRSLNTQLSTINFLLVTSQFMCGPHFCSMRITEDVRRYAAERGIEEEAAIEDGLKRKAMEFTKSGAAISGKPNKRSTHG